MNGIGADENEMRRFAGLDDRELSALLAGKAPAGREELDELVSFLRETAVAFEQAPDRQTEARHLAAIQQAHAARGPVSDTAQTTTRSDSSMSFIAKIAIAAVVVLAAFSGVAYAGALPGPVQDPVANFGDNLGVSLPGGDDENDVDDGDQNNLDNGKQDDVDDGPVGQLDEPEMDNKDDGTVGDRDEGQVGNNDDAAQNDMNDAAQNDRNDAAQNDKDDAAQNDRDDGAQNDEDQGAQNDRDDDSPIPAAPAHQQQSGDDDGEGAGQQGEQGGNDN